jgi:DNA-binding NtrC family response regulator
VKLLRLLESGTYRRVGSTELRRTDVRVVSATHRDLQAMTASGQFREDLYYRLSTFPIRLPALRERTEDIPLLAVALLARVAPQRRLALSAAALQALQVHRFPGNVRELRNVLERAALLCDGSAIEAAQVQQALATATASATGGAATTTAVAEPVPTLNAGTNLSLRAQADATLRAQLQAHRGSRAELARQLGISERSLYRRLREIDGTG